MSARPVLENSAILQLYPEKLVVHVQSLPCRTDLPAVGLVNLSADCDTLNLLDDFLRTYPCPPSDYIHLFLVWRCRDHNIPQPVIYLDAELVGIFLKQLVHVLVRCHAFRQFICLVTFRTE